LAPAASRRSFFARLAAGRYGGGPLPVSGVDSRGDDGHRRTVHADAHERHFQHSQTMMLVVAVGGAFTAIFGRDDRHHAKRYQESSGYSTGVAAGLYVFWRAAWARLSIGIFHVMTHAFFKALMFFGAGSAISGMLTNRQRRMAISQVHAVHVPDVSGRLAGDLGIIPSAASGRKTKSLAHCSTSALPIGWLLWIVGTIAPPARRSI